MGLNSPNIPQKIWSFGDVSKQSDIIKRRMYPSVSDQHFKSWKDKPIPTRPNFMQQWVLTVKCSIYCFVECINDRNQLYIICISSQLWHTHNLTPYGPLMFHMNLHMNLLGYYIHIHIHKQLYSKKCYGNTMDNEPTIHITVIWNM